MKTNSILCLLIIGLILTFISCKTLKVKKESDAKPPNFIVILTDDQGWGDLSINGNKDIYTPNIDQMALNESISLGSKFYETPNIDKLANESFQTIREI